MDRPLDSEWRDHHPDWKRAERVRDRMAPTLGQYDIVEKIGKGGMSTVYLAKQESIGREVAIKVLLSGLIEQDETFLDRFYREVQVSAKLQHPHILPVYDYGVHEGQPFIVMAYMGGGTLADRIKQGPMSLSEILSIVAQVSEALDFAHNQGVIHRDVKPSNVMLDHHGNTYLADFGLAKVSDAAVQLTGSRLVGTPDYMAPDLALDTGLSPAVDVYALGITLFQMLTGYVPFKASTPMGVLMAHISNPIPDVRAERPDIPETVQQVIATAMAKKASERYPAAGVLCDALTAASKEPQHTPHALLFTDINGQVIFVNSHLLQMTNRSESEARSVVGKQVHEVLGIEEEVASHLIADVARIGRVYSRPLRLHDPSKSPIEVLCTAEATYDEKGNCIGADLTLRLAAAPGGWAVPGFGEEADFDTSEITHLQLYFSSQLDALRVLLIRIGGTRLGQTLERIINETSERNGWNLRVKEGRVEKDMLTTEPSVYHALLAKGVNYAVNVIGPDVVNRQMQAVDDQMGERSLELAKRLGLREIVFNRL